MNYCRRHVDNSSRERDGEEVAGSISAVQAHVVGADPVDLPVHGALPLAGLRDFLIRHLCSTSAGRTALSVALQQSQDVGTDGEWKGHHVEENMERRNGTRCRTGFVDPDQSTMQEDLR